MALRPNGEGRLVDKGLVAPSPLSGPDVSLTEVVVILRLADLLVHVAISFS